MGMSRMLTMPVNSMDGGLELSKKSKDVLTKENDKKVKWILRKRTLNTFIDQSYHTTPGYLVGIKGLSVA